MLRKLTVRSIISLVLWFTLDSLLSILLFNGLSKNYGLKQYSEAFIVGHSHVIMALDRKEIEDSLGIKLSKYTREGVNMKERLLMTKQYLSSPYADSVKYVIVGVDIYSFQQEGLSENSHLLFYPFFDDTEISHYLKSECSTWDYCQHKYIRLSRYSDDVINASFRGWTNDDRNRKTNQFDAKTPEAALKKWMRPIGFNKELMNSLDSIIDISNRTGAITILLNTPTMSIINRYQPERYDSIISYYHNRVAAEKNVYFLDLNPTYQDSIYLFSDPVHMNVEGRKRVTDALINYIRQLDD